MELARTNALNKARAQEKEDKRLDSESILHPQARMEIFFKNASSMSMLEQASDVKSPVEDFESLPRGSALVINELVRMENEKGAALLRADDMVDNYNDGNPYTQRANIFERMWVLVSEENHISKICSSVFLELRKEAKKNHQQIAACKNCATIFFPFFPDEYHMHQRSAKFKSYLASRLSGGDQEALQKAIVELAKEARAYKKEDNEEFIKIIRVVKGIRSNVSTVKYDRFELCENSNVDSYESTSNKTFQSRNLAVGILKLVIQLHFKIPIPSKLIKLNQHGAGLADYFQRYRHFVPEFKDETLFRCFLVEFGQHVRRADQFDSGYTSRTNWWSGSSQNNFVESDPFGILVQLDKHGLVQLAKSLAQRTFRVLDDFCNTGKNIQFLGQVAVNEDVLLREYIDQIPAYLEEEKLEKELLPVLRPLEVAVNPEARNADVVKKISDSKLKKRRPDLTEKELMVLEKKRLRQQERRKKATQKPVQGKFRSFRR